MPVPTDNGAVLRKRKRTTDKNTKPESKPRKAPKIAVNEDSQAKILSLEERIVRSRDHYNDIVKLQTLVSNVESTPETSVLAAVALCRVFCRLLAREDLALADKRSDVEVQDAKWLKARLQDYVNSLTNWIGGPDAAQENTALTLLMRVVKEETAQSNIQQDSAWRSPKSSFVALVWSLVREENVEGARQEYAEKYMDAYDDVRYYTFAAIKQCLTDSQLPRERIVDGALDLLNHIESMPEGDVEFEEWYGQTPQGHKNPLLSANGHRKIAREAWLSIFRSSPSLEQRQRILEMSTSQVLPWFYNHIELLTDFMTDSFDHGGASSLLALSGIFNMMTQKNLDYPDFYTKLYSLLDDDLMHSKHRSRFFRLLNTCMNSTHLPAALVASFIKRLARLALQAPPGGIVWIVPWVYNMLKQHPTCTFMLHRTYHPAHQIFANNLSYQEEGMDDAFNADEPDPLLTDAIESSLWELETLQSHYHPNVATLAKIMSEQFTKRDYHLEDFLDHSHASLIEAELSKEIKKPPVVEWEIPKHIVTAQDGSGLNNFGGMLQLALKAA